MERSGSGERWWQIYQAVLLASGVVLLLLNGLEERVGFEVDQVTLLLLLGLAVPALAKYLEEVKAGDWHVRFRAMSMEDQLLTVIPDIGRGRLWTFYETRSGEHDIGEGFRFLFEVLLRENRPKLIAELKEWLSSGDEHLVWLATEVVGYFEIEELEGRLEPLYEGLPPDQQWERWQLNALWAHARITGYQEMQELLMRTSDPVNQRWLLFAYRQMLQEHGNVEAGELLLGFVDRFLAESPPESREVEKLAREVRRQLAERLEELKAAAPAS